MKICRVKDHNVIIKNLVLKVVKSTKYEQPTINLLVPTTQTLIFPWDNEQEECKHPERMLIVIRKLHQGPQ